MIGHWLDAVECGCTFGRDHLRFISSDRIRTMLGWVEMQRDPVWVHGYRIGCYIRDAWQRLR